MSDEKKSLASPEPTSLSPSGSSSSPDPSLERLLSGLTKALEGLCNAIEDGHGKHEKHVLEIRAEIAELRDGLIELSATIRTSDQASVGIIVDGLVRVGRQVEESGRFKTQTPEDDFPRDEITARGIKLRWVTVWGGAKWIFGLLRGAPFVVKLFGLLTVIAGAAWRLLHELAALLPGWH